MMNELPGRTRRRAAVALLLVATLSLLVGGCPIDTDALVTDVVAAALESASNSLVDTLSSYLTQP